MRPEERALLQERVKTLVLRHALAAALERLTGTAGAAGLDAAAELAALERRLVEAARGLADRAASQKLAVLYAAEEAAGTLRTAFAGARTGLDAASPSAPAEALAA